MKIKKSDSSSQIKSQSKNQTFFYQLLPPPHHQPPQELPDEDPLSREDQELNQESLSYDELEESLSELPPEYDLGLYVLNSNSIRVFNHSMFHLDSTGNPIILICFIN